MTTEVLENAVTAFVLSAKQAVDLSELTVSNAGSTLYGANIAKPRFTPETWLQLFEWNTRMGACAAIIARSSVGLGAEAVTSRQQARRFQGRRNLTGQLEVGRAVLQAFIDKPNFGPEPEPFTEACYKAELDLQICGNGYLEIVEDEREAGSEIVALGHISAAFTRVTATKEKFTRFLGNSNRLIHYRRLGDDSPDRRFIDKWTGEFYSRWPTGLPESRKGTAVLHFRTYCPLDDYYGMPPAVTALYAITGNRLTDRRNIAFMQNSAQTPTAIIVENGNLSPDSLEAIEVFLTRDAKGVKNAGRLLLLQPDMDKISTKAGPKIRLEEIKTGFGDDPVFLKYKQANNSEVQEAYGLASIFLGLGEEATRATAATARQISHEQIIEPRALSWEFMINSMLTPKIGSGNAIIRFRRPFLLDSVQRATVTQKLRDGLSANDLREVAAVLLQTQDLGPIDEPWANLPLVALQYFFGLSETAIEKSVVRRPLPQTLYPA